MGTKERSPMSKEKSPVTEMNYTDNSLAKQVDKPTVAPNNFDDIKLNMEKEKSPTLKESSEDPTTAQQRLQQKLMNEALQKVEFKKERAKQLSNTRHNPTIAAMEIMTRKEIKAGEMEERLARGEVPDIPIPP